MKIFAKIAALGIAATMAVAPAHAAFVFDFGNTAGQSNNGVDGPDGNSRTYSATDGGETVNVRVTGWSTDGNTVQNAFLGAYNNAGLGVTNRGETGNNGSHAIDNIGNIDFVIMQFDRMMQIDGAFFNAITQNNVRDTDATFAFGNTALGLGGALNLNGQSVSALGSIFPASNYFNSFGTSASGYRNVNPDGGSGNIWAISALTPVNGISDSFKLRAVTASAAVGAVPEPATWAMMILGFGLIGGTIRMRNKGGVLQMA